MEEKNVIDNHVKKMHNQNSGNVFSELKYKSEDLDEKNFDNK